MATITPPPDGTNPPAHRGRVSVKTWRGKTYISAWPKKRGPSKRRDQKWRADTFREATKLIKLAPASQQILSERAVKGSQLYPRDLLMRAMLSGIFDIRRPDGTIQTIGPKQVERAVFVGARVGKSSTQAIAANTITTVTWNDPILDTMGFWDPASPNQLRIPAGIQVVEVFAGVGYSAGGDYNLECRLSMSGKGIVSRPNYNVFGFGGLALSTGPIPVTEGDTINLQVEITAAGTIANDYRTYIGLNVLGTI